MPPSRADLAEGDLLDIDVAADAARPARAHRERVQNHLLRALPPADLDRVLDRAELVPLRPRQVLIEANLSVLYGYFIETGVASVLGSAGSRKPMEVCLIGRRGFVGLPLVLGTGRAPLRCMVQIHGEAWRIPAADFRHLLDECTALRRIVLAHIQGRLTQEALLNVCNASHTMQERICRWLMMVRDRLKSDHVPATHDLVARMLGVRRPGVTDALGSLEKKGVIRLTRGRIEIRQSRVLERSACRCLHRIDSEYDRLLREAVR